MEASFDEKELPDHTSRRYMQSTVILTETYDPNTTPIAEILIDY